MKIFLLIKNIQTAFILLLALFSCNKDDVSINDLKNKFSCTIQGEEFFPKKIGSPFLSVFLTTTKDTDHNSFSINVRNDSKRYMNIRLDINTGNEPLKEKEYILKTVDFDNLINSTRAECYFEKSGASEIQLVDESKYYTADNSPGAIRITKIDTLNNTIKGQFQFQAINKFNEIIIIENGKFDLNYFN